MKNNISNSKGQKGICANIKKCKNACKEFPYKRLIIVSVTPEGFVIMNNYRNLKLILELIATYIKHYENTRKSRLIRMIHFLYVDLYVDNMKN
jgi:hypothetical protein